MVEHIRTGAGSDDITSSGRGPGPGAGPGVSDISGGNQRPVYDDYSDEEFDETGIETPRSLRNDKSITSFSNRDELSVVAGDKVSSSIIPIRDHDEDYTSRYIKYRSRNGTPLKQPPINSSRMLSNVDDVEFDGDEVDDRVVRSHQLISPSRNTSSSKYVLATPVKSTTAIGFSSPPSNLKFSNSIQLQSEIGISGQNGNKEVLDVEFDSSDDDEQAPSEVPKSVEKSPELKSGERDVHKTSIHESYQQSIERIVTRPPESEKSNMVQLPVSSKPNSPQRVVRSEVDVSRESIIQKVNHTLDALNQSTNRLRSITSSPKPKVIDVAKDNEDDVSSLESEPDFVHQFLSGRSDPVLANSTPFLSNEGIANIVDSRSPTRSSTKKDAVKSKFRIIPGWSAAQWMKLNRIVKSNKIKRKEAINSTYLLQVLDCTKNELKQRYDFLLKHGPQEPKRRSTKKV